MKKRWIAAIIVVLVVIAAAVCLLPKRTHVEARMTGTLLHGEKVAEEPVYVTVQGHILDNDRVDFRFLQSGIDNWLCTEFTDPVSRMDRFFGTPYIISTCSLYKVSENTSTFAHYAFSPEEEMLLIYLSDDMQPVIACSANGEKTLEEIKEYFSVFVENFSVSN